jgi:hypothetical protein
MIRKYWKVDITMPPSTARPEQAVREQGLARNCDGTALRIL